MKKVLMITVIIAMAVVAIHHSTYYTLKGCEVVNVTNGIITAEDKNGNLWEFEDEGYVLGQKIDLKMQDCNVDRYYKDSQKIVKVIKR